MAQDLSTEDSNNSAGVCFGFDDEGIPAMLTGLLQLECLHLDQLPPFAQRMIIEKVQDFKENHFGNLRLCSRYWKAVCDDNQESVSCDANRLADITELIDRLPSLKYVTISGDPSQPSSVDMQALASQASRLVGLGLLVDEGSRDSPKLTVENLASLYPSQTFILRALDLTNCHIPPCFDEGQQLDSLWLLDRLPMLRLLSMTDVTFIPALTSLDLSTRTGGCLEVLECVSCNLHSLDVTAHKKLKELRCTDNYLTSLNLSANTALVILECQRNQLSDLELSGCVSMRELTCRQNKLKSISLSACPLLRLLDSSANLLTDIDLSVCTSIQQIWLDFNQLSYLNLAACTELKTLVCARNNLTTLDCASVERLDCSRNSLRQLNLSNCAALEFLVCNNNVLLSVEVSPAAPLRKLISGNNSSGFQLHQGSASADLQLGHWYPVPGM